MKIQSNTADEAILRELGNRLCRRRLEHNLTQAVLATESGVSKRTIERLEAGGSVQLSNLIRVLRALSIAENLDALIPEILPSPMQKLKLRGKTRKRATGSRNRKSSGKWSWGNDQ